MPSQIQKTAAVVYKHSNYESAATSVSPTRGGHAYAYFTAQNMEKRFQNCLNVS